MPNRHISGQDGLLKCRSEATGCEKPRTLKLFEKIQSLSCLRYSGLNMSVPRKIRINVDTKQFSLACSLYLIRAGGNGR